MEAPELSPLWDEAIAGMLSEEQASIDVPLDIEKLQALAIEHAIRLGDIIETLYLMVIYGDWMYSDREGVEKDLDEQALEDLYAHGRIDQSNAASFSGHWTPVQ